MKRISILLTFVVVGFVTSCGMLGSKDKRTKFDDPEEYNRYIVGALDPLDKDYDAIWGVEVRGYQETKVAKLAINTKAALAKLNNLQPYKKDSTLRDAAIEYVTFMDKIANKDIPEFFDIFYSVESPSEKNQARMDVLIQILDEERPKKLDSVIEVQKMFALKHKYTLKPEK